MSNMATALPKLAEGMKHLYPQDGNPTCDYFQNSKGLCLCGYRWEVEQPKAIVIAVHGIQMHCRHEFLTHTLSEKGEYVPKQLQIPYANINSKDTQNLCVYANSWVEQFNQKGVTVCGLDLQGHGLSDSWNNWRGNVQQFDDFAYDVIQYMQLVINSLVTNYQTSTEQQPNIPALVDRESLATIPADLRLYTPNFPPVYLMGISMGSAVCLRTLEILSIENHALVQCAGRTPSSSEEDITHSFSSSNQYTSVITGCICLASMLSVKAKKQWINRVLLKFGKFLSNWFPNWPIGQVEHNNRFPFVDTWKIADPLIAFPNKVAAHLALECVNGVDTIQNAAGTIVKHLRLLFVHSKNDSICEIEGTETFFSKLVQVDKEFWKLENLWHAFTQEDENGELVASVLDWLLKPSKTDGLNGSRVVSTASRL